MKKLLVLVTLLLARTAHADCVSDLGNAFTPNQTLQICSVLGTAIGSSLVPETDNAIDLGTAAKEFRSAYIGTSVTYGSGAGPVMAAASVITPSTGVPTPSAGNTLTNRTTILAAGAPTAAYVVLPVITSATGKSFKVYNQGSNPLAIVPQTGVINVSAALTPFSCTTLKECNCQAVSNAAWGCSQQ